MATARAPVTLWLQNQNATPVIATPGLKKQLVIHKGGLRHRNNVNVIVELRSNVGGVAGPVVYRASLTALDSTASFDFDSWALPENAALEAFLNVAGSVDINVTSFHEEDL